jgi:BASS family bile acid:Na+ symporter
VAVFDPAGVAVPADLPLAATARAVLLITALPMVVGMALRVAAPALALACLVPARHLATFVFAGIVVAAFAADWSIVETHAARLGPAVVAFNATAVGIGLGLGRLARLEPRTTLTLAVECGLQNVALALFLGGGVLGEPALMVPAILYVFAMNASALVLVAQGRRLGAAAPRRLSRPPA